MKKTIDSFIKIKNIIKLIYYVYFYNYFKK